MSTISNKNVIKGTLITASDLNQKFSNVTTATTGNLDDLNVRSEAIDTNNVNTVHTSGQSGLILKDTGTHDNGSRPAVGGAAAVAMTVYNSSVGPGPGAVVINHGPSTGTMAKTFVIKAGDVLRVQWQIWVEDYPTHGSRTWSQVGGSTIGFAAPRYPCWMTWLQWETGGAWTEVPGQSNFNNVFGADRGGLTAETEATLVIPHGTLYYARDSTGPSNQSAWLRERGRAYRQSWNYAHTGADITITGLRLMVDGVYHPRNEPVTGDANAFCHENRGWSGVVADNQITLGTVNIVAIHMEKD